MEDRSKSKPNGSKFEIKLGNIVLLSFDKAGGKAIESFILSTGGVKVQDDTNAIDGGLIFNKKSTTTGVIFRGKYEGYSYTISKGFRDSKKTPKSKIVLDYESLFVDVNPRVMPYYSMEVLLNKKFNKQISVCLDSSQSMGLLRALVVPESSSYSNKIKPFRTKFEDGKINKYFTVYAADQEKAQNFFNMCRTEGLFLENKTSLFTKYVVENCDSSLELVSDKIIATTTILNEKWFKKVISIAKKIEKSKGL